MKQKEDDSQEKESDNKMRKGYILLRQELVTGTWKRAKKNKEEKAEEGHVRAQSGGCTRLQLASPQPGCQALSGFCEERRCLPLYSLLLITVTQNTLILPARKKKQLIKNNGSIWGRTQRVAKQRKCHTVLSSD